VTDLSPTGHERKDQMLDELQERVTARRRRRRAVRTAGAVAPVVVVGIIAVLAGGPTQPGETPSVARVPDSVDANTPQSSLSFKRIGDEELLELLREADCPGGIVRRAGVTTVAFENPECAPTFPGAG
jgi:hypothetical protein